MFREFNFPSVRAVANVSAATPTGKKKARRLAGDLNRACSINRFTSYSGNSPGNALDAHLDRLPNRSDEEFFVVQIEKSTNKITIYQLPYRDFRN